MGVMWALLLGLLLGPGIDVGEEVVTSAPATPADSRRLPSVDCVTRVRRARLAWEASEAERALGDLEAAVDACPEDLEPLLLRLEILRRLGRLEEMTADLDRLDARLAGADAPLALGSLIRAALDPHLGATELEAVRHSLEGMIAGDGPVDPRARRALAVVCGRLGDADTARDALAPLLTANAPPEVRWAAAQLDLGAGRWERAAAQLEAIIRDDPELADSARLLLVQALAGQGRFEDVLAVSRTLQETSGHSVAASGLVGTLLEAGWIAHDAGQDDAARRLFGTVLELDPDNLQAEDVLANLLGDLETRIAHAARRQEALTGETDPSVLLEEGTRLLAAGDAAGAVEALQRAATDLPDNGIAWSNLGVAAIRLERWELAADALSRATVLEPDDAGATLNLGTALARLERCTEAIEVLDALVAAHPELWQAEYWRWSCLGRLGRPDEAQAALVRYEIGRER